MRVARQPGSPVPDGSARKLRPRTPEGTAMAARSKPSLAVRAFWYVALALAVGAFLFQLMRGSVRTMEVGQVARAYVALVRQGKLDAAYAMLSSATRQKIPRGGFSGQRGTLELQRAGSVSFKRHVEMHGADRACLATQLSGSGKPRHADVFLRRESGAWRVVTVQVDGAGAPAGPWPCSGR